MRLEAFLARLYGSEAEAARFLDDRALYARAAGLAPADLAAVLGIDAADLRFAAWSYACKRRGRAGPAGP